MIFHSTLRDSLSQSIGVSRPAVVRFARGIAYARGTELQLTSRHASRTSRELPLSRLTPAYSGSLVEPKAIQGLPQRAGNLLGILTRVDALQALAP
jgi:DNA-binding MurR/RpiR family transcriptional regulator